ncbi:hypothetical protein TNIN_461281 [Trichonephila inaurata madagascariensis]|uniref:Uncharacterized protein n=1 Tax=Trichonephila inaurata madagascariensis TaxID=2747483 RepID=A0A8X6YBD3_9ARAC|nr:hypothetical protein TNIN_461281 [Trichonephila inaurata madagascariensis]
MLQYLNPEFPTDYRSYGIQFGISQTSVTGDSENNSFFSDFSWKKVHPTNCFARYTPCLPEKNMSEIAFQMDELQKNKLHCEMCMCAVLS